MGRPIEIQIDTKTSGAEAGLERVADGVERVSDALDDVGDAARDATRDTDKVADSLEDVGDAARDGGRDAERGLEDVEQAAKAASEQAEKLDRDLTEALDHAAATAKTSGDSIGRDTKRGMDDAGAATEDFKNEAKQNLSETVSSFRGDIEDIPQIAQDILGGIIPDLGAVGAGVAAAVAAGIGITIQQLQDMSDRINKAKEDAAALAAEILDTGRGLEGIDLGEKMREWSFEINDARQWWEVWQSDAVTNIEQVARAADTAGVDLGELWNVMTSADLDKARDMLARLKDEQVDLATYAGMNSIESERLTKAYQNIIGPLEDHIDQTALAEDMARKAAAAEAGVSEAVIEQADALRDNAEAQAEQAKGRQDALDTTRSLAEAEIDYAEKVSKTSETIATNGATLDLNTEAGRANKSALLDLSEAALDQAEAMAEAGASTDEVSGYLSKARQDFLNAAHAAGVATDDAEALADAYLGVPGQVATDVTTTAKAAKSDTRDYISEVKKVPMSTSTTLGIKVDEPTTLLQQAIDRAARSVVPPTITYMARVGAPRAV